MTCTTYKKLLPKRSGCDADASAFYSGCNDNVSKTYKNNNFDEFINKSYDPEQFNKRFVSGIIHL